MAGVVLAACALAFVLAGASGGGGGKGMRFKIEFDNAFGLVEGGDLKVAGVRAGKTTTFDITGGPRPKAIANAEITEPGMEDLRKDASCSIKPQSLIGEYFVDCQPGRSRKKLGDGGRVPVAHTVSTIPVDLINNILRRPYRERLRLIVNELGSGLAGRPQDLGDVIKRAHPGLRETTKTLRILGAQTQTIERMVVNSDTDLAALARRKTDVSRFVHEARNTAEITATRRAQLARTFNRLPAFLGELRPYMARLGDLTEAQTPLLRNLRASSGDLDLFLKRLQPFSKAARPALLRLGRASVEGSKAVRKTRREVAELRRLARGAPGLAKPLRQFLTSIDDRRRAAEPDPRAAETGPPAGDPTHIPSGSNGGFTGMEAIWDYFYWQALSTNGLDDVGHILRLTTIINECSPYQVRRQGNEALFNACNEWLGPNQPGITTPDPTEIPGEKNSAGNSPPPPPSAPQPPSAPTPAPQPPQLPGTLNNLLGSASKSPTPAPRPQPRSSGSDVPLLDYLLSP